MVNPGGPPRCPLCEGRLGFGTDRLGRTTESCLCGYLGYVALRDAEHPLPPPGPVRPAA